MRAKLGWLTAIALAGNGMLMLCAPAAWYGMVPGVPDTGPLNPHFVRDIGCAYLVAGAALGAFLVDARARAATLAGGAFLALHALVHVLDAIRGVEPAAHWALDLVLVGAPPVIVLRLALAQLPARGNRHAEMTDTAPARRLRAGQRL